MRVESALNLFDNLVPIAYVLHIPSGYFLGLNNLATLCLYQCFVDRVLLSLGVFIENFGHISTDTVRQKSVGEESAANEHTNKEKAADEQGDRLI